jgi:hypothetical protein
MDVFEKSKRKFRTYSTLAVMLAVGLVGWGGYNMWMGHGYQVDPLILIGSIMCLWVYTLVDAGRAIEMLNKENFLLRRQNIDKDRRYVRAHDVRVEGLMR